MLINTCHPLHFLTIENQPPRSILSSLEFLTQSEEKWMEIVHEKRIFFLSLVRALGWNGLFDSEVGVAFFLGSFLQRPRAFYDANCELYGPRFCLMLVSAFLRRTRRSAAALFEPCTSNSSTRTTIIRSQKNEICHFNYMSNFKGRPWIVECPAIF